MSYYVKSPIRYTGNKYVLLDVLLRKFPKDINVFLDVFGGAGTVSFNVKANKVICNDITPFVKDIFTQWKQMSLNDILELCDKYKIMNKELFMEITEEYNITRDSNLLFILICNSFNHQISLNSSGNFNSSFKGDRTHFNPNIIQDILDVYPLLNKIDFVCNDFRDLDYSSLTSKDLVYFDPPYTVSWAIYQSKSYYPWSESDDLELMSLCDILDSRGVKFAFSNMFTSKNNYNMLLMQWASKYSVKHIDKTYYVNRKVAGYPDDEILVTNF